MIINAFEDGVFPLPKKSQQEKWSKESDEESDEKLPEWIQSKNYFIKASSLFCLNIKH